jgi:hypothetical protein
MESVIPARALRPTTMTEARASLRRGLAGTLEAAGSLGGDADLIKAIEIALSVLDAPGPLNRTTLAPVMSTVHEGLVLPARDRPHDRRRHRDTRRLVLRDSGRSFAGIAARRPHAGRLLA